MTLHRLGLYDDLAVGSREEAAAVGAPFPVANVAGDLRRGVSLYLESLRSAFARGDLPTACMDLGQLSRLRSALGELDAAEGCAEWVSRIAGRVSQASTLFVHLIAARAGLTFTKAEGLEADLAFAEAIPEPELTWTRAVILSGVACAYAHLGKSAEALKRVREVLPAIERAPGWSGQYPLLVHLAVEALWLVGEGDSSELLERNLREKVLAPDFRSPHADARLSLARLCALQARFEEALAWFAKAREVLEEQGARPLRAIADYDEALMHVRRGEPGDRERAESLLQRAIEQFRTIGMPGWERHARRLLAPTQP
jgi:tetratricopeptide (TPR) repeat protein